MKYFKKIRGVYVIGFFFLIMILTYDFHTIQIYKTYNQYKPHNVQEFRQMKLPEEMITLFAEETNFIERKRIKKVFKSTWFEYYQTILQDIQCFPIAKDTIGHETTSYDDSWMSGRTYGGKRFHEGTDIMTSNNQRGYFQVISITDGIVEKKGWLEKGGYRIGIRSPSGAYFYYAHLYQYAPDLKEGSVVEAGQLLGWVGDSGYSKIEGTVGNFDVHLHVGIYMDICEEETSVNPYWILKFLEKESIVKNDEK